MPFKIEIIEAKVVVTFTGVSDLAENVSARDELVKINKNTGHLHVISDWREASICKSVSSKDLLDFGNTWPSTSDGRRFVVAVVLSNTNKAPHSGVDFSNSVGRKTGIVSRMFWEINDAFDWLENSITT